MQNLDSPLYITRFEKNGHSYPVLKSHDKIVTFDVVIMLAITGLSYTELMTIDNYIIMERSKVND